MIEIIRLLIFSSTLCSISILIALAFTLSVFAIIYFRRQNNNLKNMSFYVDILPLFAGLVPFTGLIDELINISKAVASISASGVGDPKVVCAGFAEIFFILMVCGSSFFIFLGAWLILRMIYKRFTDSNVSLLKHELIS